MKISSANFTSIHSLKSSFTKLKNPPNSKMLNLGIFLSYINKNVTNVLPFSNINKFSMQNTLLLPEEVLTTYE